MRLSSLLVVGALLFGGLYVARNVDTWRSRLHEEKAHAVASLKKRVNDEEAQIREAVRKRVATEKARAAAELRKQRARARTQKAAAERVTKRAASALPASMTESAFWALISETRNAAGNDTGRQSELLKDRLTQLAPQAIVAFAQIRHSLDERAYTWNLWGAAMVIEDGCSDDCFRDFRAYLISLGRGPYAAALRDPDSLAPIVQDAEQGDWEDADIPAEGSDVSGDPRGEPWDDENQEALVQRYPRLAARFR